VYLWPFKATGCALIPFYNKFVEHMKLYPIIFTLVISETLLAQTNFQFADNSARWNMLESIWGWAPPQYNNFEFYVCGDTTAFGNQYQKICETNNSTSPIFVRKDTTGKVFTFAYSDSVEHKIYDFSKNAGDTFTIKNNRWNESDIYIRVDSIETIMLDRPRKKMYLTTGYSFSGLHNYDVWIEGIGSLITELWSPGYAYQVVDGPMYETLCFFENGQMVFHNSNYAACTVTGLDKNESEKILLGPNPVSNILSVQLSGIEANNTLFMLYDVSGRIVFEKYLYSEMSYLSVQKIERGLYFYRISKNKADIYSGKIIVE
jgi:hypothetical protein